ncbi:hypothetical protein EW145_g5024 [Phellinidium pouzarii]|uniref:Uncharacterized protein n=1 Tax=Phellinidium pouzarii TaxID=167371 RepID=A0A4S4L1M3_9AGAM|nr:hypothetical protein EW145_g5024 [Phellinidium pouzarii]
MTSQQFTNSSSNSVAPVATTLPEQPRYDGIQSSLNTSAAPPDASNAIFEENKYGELSSGENADTVPASAFLPDTKSAGNSNSDVEHPSGSHRFGEGTQDKAEEYRSDQTYPENRFGELGRADTYINDQPHLSDKIKGIAIVFAIILFCTKKLILIFLGTAEQIVGKLTFNKELHDKGISRKNQSPER